MIVNIVEFPNENLDFGGSVSPIQCCPHVFSDFNPSVVQELLSSINSPCLECGMCCIVYCITTTFSNAFRPFFITPHQVFSPLW